MKLIVFAALFLVGITRVWAQNGDLDVPKRMGSAIDAASSVDDTSAPSAIGVAVKGQIDLRRFGAVLDGVRDDSCAMKAAATALAGTGIAIYIAPGEKLNMGGACSDIPLRNIAITGAGIHDNAYPYGEVGSQIYIRDTSRSPFLIAGNNVLIDGVNLFWPSQVERPSGPIRFPPAFTDHGIGVHNNWVLKNVQVTNAYDFFSARSVFGFAWFGPDNIINALHDAFILQNNPAEIYVDDTDFSTGAYGSEMNHFGTAGSGGVLHVITSDVTGRGSSSIALAATTGIPVQAMVSGSRCVRPGSYVGSVNTHLKTITVVAPFGRAAIICPIVSGTSLRLDDYALLNFAASHGSVFHIVGNGAPAAGCTNCGTGGGALQWSNSYIHGYQNAIRISGGDLSLTNLSNVSLEVEHALNVEPGGEFVEVQFLGGIGYFSYKGRPNIADCDRGAGFLIDLPAPAKMDGSYNRLRVKELVVPFMEGELLYALGANIDMLDFSENDVKNWTRFGACPGQYAAVIHAPMATFKWNQNDIASEFGTPNGVQLISAAKAEIEGGFIGDPRFPVGTALDVETPYAPVTVQGLQVASTNHGPGAYDLITGLMPSPQIVSLGGSPSAGGGDRLCLTATGSFPDSPTVVCYTTRPWDTLVSTRKALIRAMETSEPLVAAGLMPGFAGDNTRIALYNSGAYAAGWSVAATGGLTLTSSLGSTVATSNLWDLGNSWIHPNPTYLSSGHITLTGSGVFPLPVHAKFIHVKLIGRGGDGGSGIACELGVPMSAGAGGGSGAFIEKIFAASDLTSAVPYKVSSTEGQPTTFGNYLQVNAGGKGANGQCGGTAAGGGGAGVRGSGGDAAGTAAGAAGLGGGATGAAAGDGNSNMLFGLGTGGAASEVGSPARSGGIGLISNAGGGSSAPGLAAAAVSANGMIGASAGYTLSTGGRAGVVGINNGDGGPGSNPASDEPGGSGGSGASIATRTGRAGRAGVSGNGAGGSGGGSCLKGCIPGVGALGGPSILSIYWN